jgi:PAS domain S-box-containing protein
MSGELILVVDDSRAIVQHLCDYLLPSLGYRAMPAFDGRRALEQLDEQEPDLVLLDLNMPEMTGLDVLQALAQRESDIPVVLMTGYGSEKDAIEAFRLGIKDYLVKPFTFDEVGEAIERALSESRLRHDNQRLIERLSRLEGDMRRQIKEMRTLLSLGKALTARLSLNQVLDHVAQGLMELTDAERGTVWLPDASGTYLHPYTKSILKTEESLHELPVATTRLGQIYREGGVLREAVTTSERIKIETDFLARAVLHVPMALQGHITGVLSATNHEGPRAFSERDELLLQAFSDFAAIAIHNARSHEETELALANHMEELKALLGITRTITATLDLKEVARLTIQEVHASFNIAASSIWLLDEDREQLSVHVNVGTDAEQLTHYRLDVGQGIVGRVVETGEPIYTNDARNHPDHFRQIDEDTGFITHSLICVPLVYNNEIIGALQLLNKQDGDFNEHDVARASSIGTAVAIAVANARLYDEAGSRQQMLAATLEHNGNPILIADSDGRILLANRHARDLFGLPQTVEGKSAADVLPVDSLVATLAQPLPENDADRHELAWGDRTWLCTVAPIPGYGRILVLQDITYLKELDEAKSNFVAAVSHDLRAPLSSIVGFSEALAQAGPLNEEQQAFAQHIANSAERMSSLVSDLLALARVDTRVEQKREVCDAEDVVRSVMVDLQGEALAKGVDLKLEKNAGPAYLWADATQIRQAVSNLVDNAIRYSRSGEEVAVGLLAEQGVVSISVRDSGPGIAPENVPYVFDKFYQVHGDQLRGTSGLGLTLVRSIAEAHGGNVQVESVVGEGSTFTLQLPLMDGERPLPTATRDHARGPEPSPA